ncbi:hypothetical protein P170DRAFT_141262 [Aspergillus steynii IBT 23096]|uniref:Uncharacterized protein n=1 Tax=Aspergillus steynii IBT 23096 TaxID=1392250 RepID=A0A2I2GBP4_9EURO|nr:uncharacterized protein P170DRAFT_141262 [Aspergillus steynii IBT 23096]PLB50293.1 hypothetical protein P170DRAFT_141262 [Aspergillus steynii IBT 23096]
MWAAPWRSLFVYKWIYRKVSYLINIYPFLHFSFTLSGHIFLSSLLISSGVLKHWIGNRDFGFVDYVIYIFDRGRYFYCLIDPMVRYPVLLSVICPCSCLYLDARMS